MPTKFRSVKRVMLRPPAHWVGDGFHVFPVFHDLAFTKDISPLLMFDYAAPKKFNPSSSSVEKPKKGVGQHPHRGFETVTIAFQGEVEHEDNQGNSGIIGSGDVQWMTAGKGIVHQEFHSNDFTQQGGILEMCQLWVNLPKQYKMTEPRYQSILRKDIPNITLPDNAGSIRLIAGEMNGVRGAAQTYSPIQMWDVTLPKKANHKKVDIPFPSNHNCMVFVRRGGIQIISNNDNNNDDNASSLLGPQDVALLHLDGTSDTIRIQVEQPDTSVLIMGGEPIDEPIVARGPFVMNSMEEIRQANMDYHSGTF